MEQHVQRPFVNKDVDQYWHNTIDFNIAVGLLLRAHERDVEQLKHRVMELTCSAKTSSTDGVEAKSANSHSSCRNGISIGGIKVLPIGDTNEVQHAHNVSMENSQTPESKIPWKWYAFSKSLLTGFRSNTHFVALEIWQDAGAPTSPTGGRIDVSTIVNASGSTQGSGLSLRAGASSYQSKLQTETLALQRFEQTYFAEHSSDRANSKVKTSINTLFDRASFHRMSAYGDYTRKCKWLGCSSFILHPASGKRLFWVACCFAILFYEILFVTMAPFEIFDGNIAKSMDVACTIFWTLDILVNFISGAVVGERVEMRLVMIGKLYLRTWFSFDFVIAALQWYTLFDQNVAALGPAGALMKLARFGRFLRIFKMKAWVSVEDVSVRSLGSLGHHMHNLVFASKIVVYLLAAVLFLHCSTCIWYGLGQAEDGWTASTDVLLTGNAFHNYLVSLHWSLSQFQGSIDIYPGSSTSNRAFACMSSSASVVSLSIFVSTLTGMIVALRDERKRWFYELKLMTRFLERHPMSGTLRARAVYHLKVRCTEQVRQQQQDEDKRALQLFPERLGELLQAEIFAPHLIVRPIFAYLSQYHLNVFVAVCVKAITQRTTNPEDELFTSFEWATQAYVIISGHLAYMSTNRVVSKFWQDATDLDCIHAISEDSSIALRSTGSTPSQAEHVNAIWQHRSVFAAIGKSDMVSEAALWMQCLHEGDLRCTSYCESLVICRATFGDRIVTHHLPHQILSEHGRRFVEAASVLLASGDVEYLDLVDSKAVLRQQYS